MLVLSVTDERYLHIRLSPLSFSVTNKFLLTEYFSLTAHRPTEIDLVQSKALKQRKTKKLIEILSPSVSDLQTRCF